MRHGHVEGIEPERFRGREQLTLTDRGRIEADAVARRIASGWRPSRSTPALWSGCGATSAAISRACKVSAEVCDDLNDIDYGAWQFRSHDEVRDEDQNFSPRGSRRRILCVSPNGETLQELVARTSNVLRLVLSRHVQDTVVIVGHDSVNRALLLQLLDQPLSSYWRFVQNPCCINEIDVVCGQARVVRINETYHLIDVPRSGSAGSVTK